MKPVISVILFLVALDPMAADAMITDKDAHWMAGISISILVLGASGAILPDFVAACPSEYRTAAGLAMGFAAGLAKEIYDGFYPETHQREFMDIVSTALGGWVGAVLYSQTATLADLVAGTESADVILRIISLGLASGAAVFLYNLAGPARSGSGT